MPLDRVLAERQVTTWFQPIIDLDANTVVAYEALSRGPAGVLESPDGLFATARREGRLAELDALCRSTALRSAIANDLGDEVALFVNIEPEVIDVAALDELIAIVDSAPSALRVVLEITEREISARPAQLLATVRRLREAGWRFALDDVGADDMSLAFMELLRPDIIKLDISLVHDRPSPAVAAIMNAVNAHAERTGAVLLAEGIETEHHLEIARALGARLGQGWMFGRPEPVPDRTRQSGAIELPTITMRECAASPFDCLPEHVLLRRTTKPLLIELSKQLELEALRHDSCCLVLSTFQVGAYFTPRTAARYREIASHGGFVAALGDRLHPPEDWNIRSGAITPDDAICQEWDLVVLTPHFAVALLARDLGDPPPEHTRRFDFALTYDRDTVCAAAEALMQRVVPG